MNKINRFMKYVDKGDFCWTWTGGKYYNGYGQFYEGPNKICAHRFSYKIFKGSIPSGKLVLHKCDNRQCVNPDHLFIGTQKDNILDMVKKGRRVHSSRVGENNGRTVLKEKDIVKIRKDYKSGVSVKNICKSYKLSETQIYRIIKKQSWSHVKGA